MKTTLSRVSALVFSAVLIACTKKPYELIVEKPLHAGEEKTVEIAPGVTIQFCWCPRGDLTMGGAAAGWSEVKWPVTLSKGYWMGKYEVTQEQWQAVMGSNPSEVKGAGMPVENVSWNDAQDFVGKANANLGNSNAWKMALPTEAQWQYAAQAGQDFVFSGGPLDDVGWVEANSNNTQHPVGLKRANSWGLHDMSGNVWEPCQDWYENELRGGQDPTGPISAGTRAAKVLRGGSYNSRKFSCGVAARGDASSTPNSTSSNQGLRVVLIPVN